MVEPGIAGLHPADRRLSENRVERLVEPAGENEVHAEPERIRLPPRRVDGPSLQGQSTVILQAHEGRGLAQGKLPDPVADTALGI
jgi:hypothetical protein